MILIISFVLILSTNIQSAQRDSSNSTKSTKIAKVMAEKLQQKILLSDSQTAKVETAIAAYLNLNVTTENETKKTLNKIESLLDTRQKAKYEIIKDDWWGYLTKHLLK
jgi:hypothetical protein